MEKRAKKKRSCGEWRWVIEGAGVVGGRCDG